MSSTAGRDRGAARRDASRMSRCCSPRSLGGHTVRLFIDHPERRDARPVRARDPRCCPRCASSYALEVSSPGRERPLTKPDHFRRFLGRRARVRTRERARRPPYASPASSSAPPTPR